MTATRGFWARADGSDAPCPGPVTVPPVSRDGLKTAHLPSGSDDDSEDREYIRGLFEADGYAEAMSHEGHD